MARPKKTEPTSVKVTALITTDEAMTQFKSNATGYLRQTITLACSAAVVLIVGTNTDTPQTQEELVTRIKADVAETGLSESQIAKYIGLARAFVTHLHNKFKVAGPQQGVLQAFTPDEAVNVLVAYLAQQHVTNLEGLTIMFDKYKRRSGKKVAKAPLPPQVETGILANKAGEQVLSHRPANLGETITIEKGPDLQPGIVRGVDLFALTPNQIIQQAMYAGHNLVELGAAVLGYANSDDLDQLRKHMLDRSRELARVRAKVAA